MSTNFKIGEVVCLNHSDILLTILEDETKLGIKNHSKICWFNEAGEFSSAVVPNNVLRKEKKVAMSAEYASA